MNDTPTPDKKGAPPRGAATFHCEGLAVSPGIAIGPAHLRDSGKVQIMEYRIAMEQCGAEVARFHEAIGVARNQLTKVAEKAKTLHGAAAEEIGHLMEAHRQMLDSRRLLSGVETRIREALLNAEAAVHSEIQMLAEDFERIDDAYLKSRAQEVREVGYRVLRILADEGFSGFGDLTPGSVVLAEEITPADTALMDPDRVAGFAGVVGGTEGHSAIMARSLGIPAVLGCGGLMEAAEPGTMVIVDGSNGMVILNPDEETLAEYRRRQAAFKAEAAKLAQLRDLPAVTTDGVRIALQTNLELPREVGQAVVAGAEGVGLLRTEFLFMNRDDLPSEDEQAESLGGIVSGLAGRPLTVRTLDVGGEKLAAAISEEHGPSPNPALGLRAVRLGLREPVLLETQLAAILRAATSAPLRILLPMISSPQEVVAVRRMLEAVAERLAKAGVRVPNTLPPLGAMIEVPGAALAADALAGVSDFFALGTNDLTMYTLAIDRGDERVAHLYNPLHPAVLRLVQFTIEAARRADIPVSVCGEVAGDPRYTPLLLGLGVRDLSMAATALPRVKARIRELSMADAEACAGAVMVEHDSARITEILDRCG